MTLPDKTSRERQAELKKGLMDVSGILTNLNDPELNAQLDKVRGDIAEMILNVKGRSEPAPVSGADYDQGMSF